MKSVTTVAVFIVALLLPGRAFACECFSGPIASSFKAAELVFVGVVTSMRFAQPNISEGEAPTIVEIQVQRGWKNTNTARVTLYTRLNKYSCEGYNFVVGQKYVVFARPNGPEQAGEYGLQSTAIAHGVDLCGGTSSIRSPNHERELEEQLRRLAGH